MARGTYVLHLDVPRSLSLEIGALGEFSLEGTYVYVGSALGPGGFARVERHRELAGGDRDIRHWHVDYLLGHPETALEAVVLFPGADCECPLATDLPGDPVSGVGASDCDCEAHLLAVSDPDSLRRALETAGGVFER